MLRAPRPKQIPIEELSFDDLRNRYQDNKNLLSKTAASSSTFVERITAEQAKIQARISEMESLEAIQKGMKKTTIDEDGMAVDLPEPSPAMLAKQKALAAWGRGKSGGKIQTMNFREALELEQRAAAIEREQRQKEQERRERLAMPSRLTETGRTMTREEYEAKVWAFMKYKPSESDLEDEDEDEDSDDPSTWFHDDQEDGIKGQNIVYPDDDDLAEIIRVDTSKVSYNDMHDGY